MTRQEMILQQLHSMGFETTDFGDMGFLFTYNEVKYLYMPDNNDEDFFRLVIPGTFDLTEENKLNVYEAMNYTNNLVKYSKTIIVNDDIWITYEHHLLSEEHLEDLIEHMINVLFASLSVFIKKVNGEDYDVPTNDKEEDGEDDELEQLLATMSDEQEE